MSFFSALPLEFLCLEHFLENYLIKFFVWLGFLYYIVETYLF